MAAVSPLGPIDPDSLRAAEEEKHAPWIVRKLVGSMAGRIAMSSFDTLRAAGTSVVCLSPWGDSSPLLLPCIRFRDIAVHTVIAATGGVAAIAAPAVGPVSDVLLDTIGDSLLVEIGMHEGFELSTKLADDFVFDHSANALIPLHSRVLASSGTKTLTITLRYKHTQEDASMGFFRSSVHADPSLFASVRDYLAIEKGWLSPYLFASGRRPVIPRTMTPDFVFCHGPFLQGDYKIADALLEQSSSALHFCGAPTASTPASPRAAPGLSLPKLARPERSRTPSPVPTLASVPAPPAPRRLAVLLLGIKPHRAGIWTTSHRPGESVLRYVLLGGAPALVLPAALGAPLVSWHAATLEELWKLKLPDGDARDAAALAARAAQAGGAAQQAGRKADEKAPDAHSFGGVLAALDEYVALCVDWARVTVPGAPDVAAEDEKRRAVREALALLLAAAVLAGESAVVKKEVDADRAGIVVWRMP